MSSAARLELYRPTKDRRSESQAGAKQAGWVGADKVKASLTAQIYRPGVDPSRELRPHAICTRQTPRLPRGSPTVGAANASAARWKGVRGWPTRPRRCSLAPGSWTTTW